MLTNTTFPSRNQADEVYRLGTARNAKPPNLLSSQYEAFQARMLTAPRGGAGPSGTDTTTTPAPAGGARRVLGDSGASNPVPFTTPAAASVRAGASSSNKGRIAVFNDSAAGPSNYVSNEWNTLGSQAAIDKENTQDATPFGGSTLHQRVSQTPKTPKFSVLKDTDSGVSLRRLKDNCIHDSHRTPGNSQTYGWEDTRCSNAFRASHDRSRTIVP